MIDRDAALVARPDGQDGPAGARGLTGGSGAQCDPAITDRDVQLIREDLGREPRGAVGVAARDASGRPLVVTTAPRLPDGTPFPTTFYLVSPGLTAACSTLEAEHLMNDYARMLADDADMAGRYRRAHADYLARRAGLGEVREIEGISAGGMPERVKCLHALVAHSLASGPGVNPVGDLALDEIARRGLWSGEIQTCGMPSSESRGTAEGCV